MTARNKDITRREFFRKSAQAAGGLIAFPYIVPSSALGMAGAVSPSNRIVMGAIGVGGMGMGDLSNFLGKREVQMVAVCDVDRDHRQRAQKAVSDKYGNQDCAGYNDFRELIGRNDIDAIMTALPDHWHAIPAIEAAKAGKDIHGQKPLAYSIPEGRAIVDAVKRHNIVWQTGSQQRSMRIFRFASELVRNGCIGKVHTVEVGLLYGGSTELVSGKPIPVPEGFDYDRWLGPAPWAPYCEGRCHGSFRWITDYSGGQITDWAGHFCDIANWGMNAEHTSPVEIVGTGEYPKDGLYDTAYSFSFECTYAEGWRMVVADDQHVSRGVRFIGSDGWVYVCRSSGSGRTYRDTQYIDAEPKSLLSMKFGPNDVRLYRSDDHKQNFLDCIRTRTQTVAPAEAGHRAIMIGHLGLIAMKLKRRLRWDGKNERFIDDEEANRMLSRPMRSPWQL